ncbi:hypothetical protein ABLE91_02945 [Aquabacter sp. CN5-332]|uniref:DUF6968 family protein n=1 Tax=Aquabacter sp. CN5-332 TaxID=3156608 RepID=UPI0032B57C08
MIAGRTLTLGKPDGEIQIPIRIFAPASKGGAWCCRYEIDWPEGSLVKEAEGIDSVQALLHAMQMVGFHIYHSDHHDSGALWLSPGRKGYYFPVVAEMRNMLVGEDVGFL